jgi:putative NADPH-quinone reductase
VRVYNEQEQLNFSASPEVQHLTRRYRLYPAFDKLADSQDNSCRFNMNRENWADVLIWVFPEYTAE